MFIHWTDIELFHNVRRTFKETNPPGDHKVTYKAKVKLHGTNAAVQRLADGTLECQSRERIITPEDDNAGFARWVMSQKEAWEKVLTPGTVVFGEWAGPGINKGMALNQIPNRIFAVFAVLYPTSEGQKLITEPWQIEGLIIDTPQLGGGVPAHVLPWYGLGFEVTVDWDQTPEELAPVLEKINDHVHAVEACDPWVKATFGIEGLGEGLVFYPQGQPTRDDITLRMFKAKGEKHQTVATKAPAQADPEVAKNLADFAVLVLAEGRLEQGAQAIKPEGAPHTYDMKLMGEFLKWTAKDVLKECQTELAASGLNEKAAMKAVSERARKWYMAKVNAE